jgi:hypothetical protein
MLRFAFVTLLVPFCLASAAIPRDELILIDSPGNHTAFLQIFKSVQATIFRQHELVVEPIDYILESNSGDKYTTTVRAGRCTLMS